jgi:hypothetical protein
MKDEVKVYVINKGKTASAHDLRRAFGQRRAGNADGAPRADRHEDIGTTVKFYVGQNAEATADAIWASHDGLTASHSAESRA